MEEKIVQELELMEKGYYQKRDECAVAIDKRKKEIQTLMTNQVAYEGMALGVRSAIEQVIRSGELPEVDMKDVTVDKVVPIHGKDK